MSGWDDPKWTEIMRHFKMVNGYFGQEKIKAVPIFESCQYYDLEKVVALLKLQRKIEGTASEEEIPALVDQFSSLRASMEPTVPDAEFAKIYLWNNKAPVLTEYIDNDDFRYNHDPDFRPFLYEFLVPEGQMPKGAVIICAGGDHGTAAVSEGYQVCKDFNAMGYHCFHLLNRTNHNPWKLEEAGVDMARAIRYVRGNARKYGIKENHVIVAGFSNGGLTCEGAIRFYSGEKKVKDIFADYTEDELDQINATPDAFLCIYGPRFAGEEIDYTGVVYPPTFFAVGRNDSAMENLNFMYPDLVRHGVKVEVHTFAGTPHGEAGTQILHNGVHPYPNFQHWETLADSFIQDVFS